MAGLQRVSATYHRLTPLFFLPSLFYGILSFYLPIGNEFLEITPHRLSHFFFLHLFSPSFERIEKNFAYPPVSGMNFYKLFSRIFFHFLSTSFSIERTFRNYFRNAQRESIIVTNIPLSPFLALENRRRIKKKKITSQRLLAARQLVTVSHYTIRESFIRKEKLVALRSFYPFIRFEPPGGRYYSVSPRYFKFTPIGMRLSLCNSFSPSPSPPLFLSLCVAASIEARRISLEQRWLFAIVATMHGDIGFSEKERPFRG